MTVCKLCANQSLKLVRTIDTPDRFERAAGVPVEENHRHWYECPNCGMATQILPIASSNYLDSVKTAYYEIDIGSGKILERYCSIMSLPNHSSDNYHRVKRILSFIGQLDIKGQFDILDIGAGTGVFIAKMRELASFDFNAVMVEPDPLVGQHLQSLGLGTVINKPFNVSGFVGKYDIITLNKIVEHLEDPVSILSGISDILRNDSSLVYIEVPDKISLIKCNDEDNMLGSMHHNLYCPSSLDKLVSNIGLKVVNIGQIHEPSGKYTVYCYASIDRRNL